jgi:hypothetical protein
MVPSDSVSGNFPFKIAIKNHFVRQSGVQPTLSHQFIKGGTESEDISLGGQQRTWIFVARRDADEKGRAIE